MTLATALTGTIKGGAILALLSIIHLQLIAQSAPPTTNADRESYRSVDPLPPFLAWNQSPFSPPDVVGNVAAAGDVNDIVRALASSGGDLYAAGDFLLAGDNVVGYVARWDGSAWIPLGDFPQGLDGPALSLAVDGNKVYVGGNFTQAGPVRTRNIAVWDKSTNTWSDMAGGIGGTLRNGVNAIAVHNGQVYVGGSFIAAGKSVATYIARWDGRRWHRVGTGVNDIVHSLYVEGNYLYVGGDFTIAGDVPAGGIARYNLTSQTWENAGVDIKGSVTAIAADDRYLYVGGVFDSVAGQRVNNIIRIEKSSGTWSPLYKGLTGYNYAFGGSSQMKAVEAIAVRGGYVYVAGTLIETAIPQGTGEDVLYLTGMARWDGTTWSNFAPDATARQFHGVGKNAPAPANVYALSFYRDDTLVLGGDFEIVRNTAPTEADDAPYLALLDPAGRYHPFSTASGNRPTDDPPANAIASAPGTETIGSSTDSPFTDPASLLDGRFGSGTDLSSSVSGAASVPDDIYWQSVGPDASTDNGVLALASDNGEVYAGGTFVNIFGITANGIAFRKNKEWFPLDDGTAVGLDGFAFALAISGSKVYVAGQFSHAGGAPANNIAVWDRNTKTWSALGSGITGDGANPAFISEILVQGNNVYVAGNFTTAGGNAAKNIARWNGTAWSPLGEGIDGTVNALEFFRGNLYAGGSFSKAGAINSNGVAYWNGTEWKAMQSGVNGLVNDLEVYHSFPGDTSLAVGGEFTIYVDTLISYFGVTDSRGRVTGTSEALYTGTEIGRNLVFWNGAGWRLHQANSDSLGSGCFSSAPIAMRDGAVRKLLSDGGDLYVGGTFVDAFPRGSGSVSGSLANLAVYNRSLFGRVIIPLWSPIQGGLNSNVNAMTILGDELIVGGDFTRASNGEMEADHVALWNKREQEWQWAGNPTALAPIRALALLNNTLYASGSFTSQQIGLFNIANQLVRLTQNGWRTVDGVVQGTPFVLTSAPNGELLSGGAIISADRKISVNVARWNSQSGAWTPLTPGSGVASLEDVSFVSALADDGEFIYVGGDFDIADTLTAKNIARWNRTTGVWDTLAGGFNAAVSALATDGNGALYAAGNFTRSGSAVLKHIARWDGTAWQPLGEGINGNVYALAFDNGVLYAAGTFDSAGTGPARNVARWDVATQSWSGLGSGLDAAFKPSVNSLSVVNGQIFAAGKFDHSGTDSISNIARWNPAGWWTSLGSGTDNQVNAMAADPVAGSLYVGGYFLSAGSKPSRYVGQWTNLTLSVAAETGEISTQILREGSPNPFLDETRIRLLLPYAQPVRLELFDPAGRNVRTLIDATLSGGEHNALLDAEELPAGVYLLRLQAGGKTESITLVKR